MSMMSMPAQPFDVTGLRDALPAVAAPVQRPQIGGTANAAWASDFLAQPVTSRTHTPTQTHAQQGQGQVQGIPAPRMDVQHDLLQNPTLVMRGRQSACLCLCIAACIADLVLFYFSILPRRLGAGGVFPWSPAYAGYGMSAIIGPTSAMTVPAQRHVVQSDRKFPVYFQCAMDDPDTPTVGQR